jgi:hypothetical protein
MTLRIKTQIRINMENGIINNAIALILNSLSFMENVCTNDLNNLDTIKPINTLQNIPIRPPGKKNDAMLSCCLMAAIAPAIKIPIPTNTPNDIKSANREANKNIQTLLY